MFPPNQCNSTAIKFHGSIFGEIVHWIPRSVVILMYLSNLDTERSRGCYGFRRRFTAAHVFQKTHVVRRREEVRANHALRTLHRRRYLPMGEQRSVANRKTRCIMANALEARLVSLSLSLLHSANQRAQISSQLENRKQETLFADGRA